EDRAPEGELTWVGHLGWAASWSWAIDRVLACRARRPRYHRVSLQADGQPRDQEARHAHLAHRRLHRRDVVGHAMPGDRTRLGVQDEMGGAWVTVTSLPDAARVDERAPALELERSSTGRLEPLDVLAVLDPGDRDMGVTVEPDRQAQDGEVVARLAGRHDV